eukprot:CFRG1643T1
MADIDPELGEKQMLIPARDRAGHSHSAASDSNVRNTVGSKQDRSAQARLAAQRKIYIATVVCFCFMCGEVVGGYISGSLAIMTDAAHLLSDIAGFFISLVALHLAGKPASHKMSFGYNRAEIVGALLSVLLIWLLTGDDHGHSHEGDKDHAHGQEQENINVKAAYIHVLGDLVQSVGVVIAASLIWWNPDLVWVDPICTFLFSILVLLTTFNLMRDALHVLMEGVPKGIDVQALKGELEALPGVVLSHDLHVWSITIGQPALAVHLCLEPDVCTATILLEAQHIICDEFGIHHSTVQLEQSNFDNHCMGMDDCNSVCVGPRGSIMRPAMLKGQNSKPDLKCAKIKRSTKSEPSQGAPGSGSNLKDVVETPEQ